MVRVDEQSVEIQFSEDSNSRMQFLLRSLKSSIFLQAVANDNLHVVGWIERATQVDSVSTFHLESWYISAPNTSISEDELIHLVQKKNEQTAPNNER